MEVRILKKTSDELKIEVEGVGHTLGNLLQKKLLENKNVELAGYSIPHPLASNSIIYVRTKGEVKPETALREALEEARKINKEFSKELERAFKKA